jgi:hypothetical protein
MLQELLQMPSIIISVSSKTTRAAGNAMAAIRPITASSASMIARWRGWWTQRGRV